MIFDEKIVATSVIASSAALLIVARKWKSKNDSEAGLGIAAWAVFGILLIWLS